jgi:hypothetical protein
MQDPITVCSHAYPRWCKELASGTISTHYHTHTHTHHRTRTWG